MICSFPADAPPGDYMLRLRVAASDKVPASRRFLEMRLPEGENDSRSVGVFQVNASLREPQVIEVPVKITPGGPRKFVFCEKKDSTGKAQALLYNRARAANGIGPDFALWIDWVEWDGPLPPGAGAAPCARASPRSGRRRAAARRRRSPRGGSSESFSWVRSSLLVCQRCGLSGRYRSTRSLLFSAAPGMLALR